jgi:hypothetical protein
MIRKTFEKTFEKTYKKFSQMNNQSTSNYSVSPVSELPLHSRFIYNMEYIAPSMKAAKKKVM